MIRGSVWFDMVPDQGSLKKFVTDPVLSTRNMFKKIVKRSFPHAFFTKLMNQMKNYRYRMCHCVFKLIYRISIKDHAQQGLL